MHVQLASSREEKEDKKYIVNRKQLQNLGRLEPADPEISTNFKQKK